MSFADAVRSGFSQYAGFTGRARRSEYWWFFLFAFVVLLVLAVVDSVIGTYPLLYGLGALALFLPSLAVAARRLHDTGRSGWWQLLGIIPLIGTIILIVWYCGDSKPDNQYGPSPKGAMGAMGAAGQPNPYAG